MSSVTYEELLREAMVDLSEMQEQDSRVTVGQGGKKVLTGNKQQDYQFFLHHWSAMYLRYVQIFRKLEQCHDQCLQPQKRQDIRVVLDSCMGRMLEMKSKIVEYCGEYVNLDEVLVDLKLTPDALEIPIPKYFVEDRANELAERQKYIESLRAQYNVETVEAAAAAAAQVSTGADSEPVMTMERAVEMLQCNERGRQGRQRAKFLKSIFEQELFQRKEFEFGQTMGKDDAAMQIQKIVRGYLARKRAKQMMKEELEFLGMEASDAITSNAQREQLTKTLAERKMKQTANIAELSQEFKDMRARIKTQEGGKTMEEMLDRIMERLAKIRLESNTDLIPDFPTPEEGGSEALFARERAAAEEAAGAAEVAKKPEEPKKPDPKPAGKGKPGEEEDVVPTLAPSMFWDRFASGRKRYVDVWHNQFQRSYFENKDFDQKFNKDLLKQEIMEGAGGTMQELRKCVDQLVAVEVANLKDRVEKKKRKPQKAKAKKAPKKNIKDPTDGKKMEVHMNQLVWLNVLQQIPTVKISDYIGAHNIMGSVMEEHERLQLEQQDEVRQKWQSLINNWNDFAQASLKMTKEQFELLFKAHCEQSSWMFEPSMLQVRQAVSEYCVLPLGSQVVHDLAPHHNAVLLYGPPGSGKTLLTHAAAAESGATLFNLNPAVLNKEGVNLSKLVQTVFRVARALAPSIIYIDEVEKVFMGGKGKKKKKGGEGAGKSGKIKKDLLQQIKELDATDRVLVIGNSSCPWEAEMKELVGFFKAMVCCVHPDYASRMLLIQTKIHQKGAKLPEDHDYEMLAFMTNKYSSGAIAKMIDDTLTERRVKRLVQRPLQAEELVPALAKAQPIFKEDYAMLRQFVTALPMNLRRVRVDDFKEEQTEDDKKAKPGKGKKPGK